jgi:MFS family permease
MRLGRRRKPDPEALEAVRRARTEALQARTEGIRVRVRGAALETRRRLRPVARPFASLFSATLGRIAPLISGALLFLLRLVAALVALVLEVGQAVLGWLGARIGRATSATYRFLLAHVQFRGTLAAVAGIAAVALGISQFFDYQAVVAGEPDYRGEVGTVAPPPRTDEEVAGGAHLYLLLPVAAAALGLVWATYRGNWRLGRWVMVLGLLGIAVSLIVDLPQGLDAGVDSVAFSGSDAELIEGFWAQLCASVVLAITGAALGAEVRRQTEGEGTPEPSEPRRRRALWRRRPRTAADGGVAAGGGTSS